VELDPLGGAAEHKLAQPDERRQFGDPDLALAERSGARSSSSARLMIVSVFAISFDRSRTISASARRRARASTTAARSSQRPRTAT
jgi:hypothetical protein